MDMPSAKPKFFYGWVITGLVFLNLGMAYGAQYSFGVLFPAMIEEFRWNRQSLAGAFSLYAFLYSFLGIILGRWVDRFGPENRPDGRQCLPGHGNRFDQPGPGPLASLSRLRTPGLLGDERSLHDRQPHHRKVVRREERDGPGIGPIGAGGRDCAYPAPDRDADRGVWLAERLHDLWESLVFAVLFTTSFFLIGYPEKVGLLPDGQKADGPGRPRKRKPRENPE